MTGDVEIFTADPRWYNFFTGDFSAEPFFTGMDATGALSRDVESAKEASIKDVWLTRGRKGR